MSHEHTPRSKSYVRITWAFAVITLIMLIIAFHPFGTDLGFEEDEEMELSVLMQFTGGQSEFGIAYSRGMALAAQEINENGGVNGVKLNVEYYDYGGDVTELKKKFFDAYDFGIPAIIGPLTSTEAIAIAPYAEMFDTVLISPSATSAELTEYTEFFYRTVPSDAYLGTGVAKVLGNNAGVSKIMAIYTEGSYGTGLKDKLVEEIEASFHEKSVVCEYAIPEIGDVDVADIVNKMKECEADGVFMVVGSSTQLVSILNGAKEAGLSPVWVGTDSTITTEIALAGEYSDGFLACAPLQTPTDPLFEAKFYDKYQTTNGIANAMYGYDTLMMVVQSIGSEGYTGDDIKAGLDDIRYVGLTGAVKFDKNGDRYPSYDVIEYDYETREWSSLKWSQMLDFSSSETGHHE